MFLTGTGLRETVFFTGVVFTAMMTVGVLMHWRDIIETVKARRKRVIR